MARRRRSDFDPGAVTDWFPIFDEIAGSRAHPSKAGWLVASNPNPFPGIEKTADIITIRDPSGNEHFVSLKQIRRDGKYHQIVVDGHLMPVMIGWYKGGKHKGYDQSGRWRTWVAKPGYYGLWT